VAGVGSVADLVVVVVVVVSDETEAGTTCLYVRISNLLSNKVLYSLIITF